MMSLYSHNSELTKPTLKLSSVSQDLLTRIQFFLTQSLSNILSEKGPDPACAVWHNCGHKERRDKHEIKGEKQN